MSRETGPVMLIAHLSDLHVCRSGALYQDVTDSNAAARAAIAHLGGLDTTPDLLLVTGDLVDHGHADEYAVLRKILDAGGIPYLAIPGNHDDRETFRTAFADHAHIPATGPIHFAVDWASETRPPVRIVAIDTTVDGEHHGHVDFDGLDWLFATLGADRTTPTVLMMHHPPFVSGIPYMDEYRYFEGHEMEAVVGLFDHVELVLCGHVHRTMLRRWAGTVIAACPSTTTEIDLQLRPDAPPSSHIGAVACMLHRWDPAHGMITHVSHIGDFAGPFPFA